MHAGERTWVATKGPLLALLAAAFAYQLVPLAHAEQTNSDAAIVGLQAMHILRGEHAAFLWGSGYQTSVDSYVAALFFALLGATPRALMISSIGLHLVVVGLVWSVVARRTDPLLAAVCALPLVFASSPVETYVLYPPREASIALAVLAAWTFDRAAGVRRAWGLLVGGAILAIAFFADPYALVFAPPVAVLGLASAYDAPRARLASRAGALFGGLAAGAVPFVLLRASRDAKEGPLTLGAATLVRNAHLLLDPCLPWALGATALGPSGNAETYGPWDAPVAVRTLQIGGGTLLLVTVLAGGACALVRGLPLAVRRLGAVGALAVPVTIAGFLASPMVMDAFSARYLVSILVLAPFALAPVGLLLGRLRFVALLAPCALATAISGVVGWGPLARDVPGELADEAALERSLEERGVGAAIADYWTAYRLTFETRERLVVVPTNPREDRYRPYRVAVDSSPLIAYVYDPRRSREDATWLDRALAAGELPFAREHDTFAIGRFTVALLRRPSVRR